MVQPSILNPPMSTSLAMFCVMLSALFLAITNTFNDVVHAGVVVDDFGLLRVLLLRHFDRFS